MSELPANPVEVLSGTARTSPIVDRVAATTDRGTEITLAISPLIERFGLRFAAAALPDGEQPGSLRAESQGAVLRTRPQPMPRPRRPGPEVGRLRSQQALPGRVRPPATGSRP